jgi:hypothetical protein
MSRRAFQPEAVKFSGVYFVAEEHDYFTATNVKPYAV